MYNPNVRITLFLFLSLIRVSSSYSQGNNPYHMNGSAYQENCNCYTLTDDLLNQSGSVWNINKIDLTQSFDYKFNVNLGCRDGEGADGMVFVLQPISTSIGSVGGGLGYQGVSPSIGVAIDTWQNTNDNDPAYDHLSIHRNGDLNHSSSNNLAGPVTASNINIEDCQWHVLHITWDAVAQRLAAKIDDKDSVGVSIDLVATVFNNNPNVFWGFTASTGGARNRQRFCTSLNPGIASFTGGTVTCYPTPIQFTDSSVSFGSIVKWYWDFGDGTKDSTKNPPPHIFPAPGIYDVKLNILGNNGCVSDTFKKRVVVGSAPVAKFGYNPWLICENQPVHFSDSSTVQFGTINNWILRIDNGQTVHMGNPTLYQHNGFTKGQHTAELTVQTEEGCISTPASKTLAVFEAPVIGMNVADACLNEAVNFTGTNLNPSVPVNLWNWNLGDGKKGGTSSVQHYYKAGGNYKVQLVAVSNDGCPSDTFIRMVTIYETHAYAGRDTIVADNQPVQLNASGGVNYSWSPRSGLSDANIPNPVAILQNDTRYILTAFAPIGCATTDTINIKVVKGPAFYVPNAFSPNNDGRNDRFRFIPIGLKEIYYFRVFNRQGQLVYFSKNAEPGWDGTVNGSLQSSGTFVWTVSGKDFNDKVHALKGTVILVR